MSQEFREGSRPEQQLNTQSEQDPKSVVTLVYRGGNPLMRSLRSDLETRGLTVSVREIPDEEYQRFSDSLPIRPRLSIYGSEEASNQYKEELAAYYKSLASNTSQLIGDFSGIVITDKTLNPFIEGLLGSDQINAEEFLNNKYSEEDYTLMLQEAVAQVREAGREPVVYPVHLRDHESPLRNKENAFDRAEIVSIRTGIEVDRNSFGPNAEKVYLVDHHIYNYTMNPGCVVVPICACCIGLEPYYTEAIKAKGYEIFPVNYSTQMNRQVDRLVQIIEQKAQGSNSELPKKQYEEEVSTRMRASFVIEEPKPAIQPEVSKIAEEVVFAYVGENKYMVALADRLRPAVGSLRLVELPEEVEQLMLSRFIMRLPEINSDARAKYFEDMAYTERTIFEALVGEVRPIMVTDYWVTNMIRSIRSGIEPINPFKLDFNYTYDENLKGFNEIYNALIKKIAEIERTKNNKKTKLGKMKI